MTELTRLNGEVIYLNYFQIQFLERIPETKVKMVNGDYYLVKNTVEDIQQKVADFFHRAVAFETKVM